MLGRGFFCWVVLEGIYKLPCIYWCSFINKNFIVIVVLLLFKLHFYKYNNFLTKDSHLNKTSSTMNPKIVISLAKQLQECQKKSPDSKFYPYPRCQSHHQLIRYHRHSSIDHRTCRHTLRRRYLPLQIGCRRRFPLKRTKR